MMKTGRSNYPKSHKMTHLSFYSPAIVHHMAALDGQPAPPNSLEAIQASLSAGASVIEIDVNALASDDYLLGHDAELEAETSGRGPVSQCSSEQARSLLIKHREVITPYRAALLSDVVRLFEKSDQATILQIDYKNLKPFSTDEPLYRLIKLIEPLGDRVIVSSGADWQLRRLRKIAAWLNLGLDVELYLAWLPNGEVRDPHDSPKILGAYGYYDDHILATEKSWPTAQYLRDRCENFMGLVPDVSVFYLEHSLIVQSLRDGFNWAETLHQGGIKLDAWTMDVTNPVAVRNLPVLLEAGVDLFTSNTPRALASLLAAHHKNEKSTLSGG
jgi:glycerophosphoryl diester phosphodiesterase